MMPPQSQHLAHTEKNSAMGLSAVDDHRAVQSEINDDFKNGEDVHARIDIIADLDAPYARGNLNKLLYRLYQESPYLKIFVNKWSEWDDFSHKDNPVAPRATFYPGVFQVFLERKLVKSYNMLKEKRQADQ